MIRYGRGGCCYFLFKIFHCTGSVFPKSLLVALPCALLTSCLTHLRNSGHAEFLRDESSVLKDNAAWGGFSFLVGFLIVFRTSQSYNRFWDGCTSTHRMRAEWFDACSSLMAFCRYKTDHSQPMVSFQNRLVRLFSMLHAVALAEIEDNCEEGIDDVEAFKYELIDASGIDDESLQFVRDSSAKVELLFQWIQQLVVQNVSNGVLSMPPPILSRSFQELSNGMVAFHDAMKISVIPFPFPYVQSCDLLLLLHMLVAPFVICQWVSEAIWAGIFAFMQVFILWSLLFIALELENPFGLDANDIDGREMQMEMNEHLLLLVSAGTLHVPELSDGAIDLSTMENFPFDPKHSKSFHQIWSELPNGSDNIARRFTHVSSSVRSTVRSTNAGRRGHCDSVLVDLDRAQELDVGCRRISRDEKLGIRNTASLDLDVAASPRFDTEERKEECQDDCDSGKMQIRHDGKEAARVTPLDLRPGTALLQLPGTAASESHVGHNNATALLPDSSDHSSTCSRDIS
mmetsp:Transcript_92134/g.176551  ORF Transcript_92134/g.176551 Transcript_92134/m.176551 type:complete len:514 (-) Transcript_92134:9-1550(-)